MKSSSIVCLLAVCLLCGVSRLQAQEQEKRQLPREVPSPEKFARKTTDQMKETLQLTEKQYDKIYKLNLKEQQEVFAIRMNGRNGQRPSIGERPEMGGSRRPGGGGMRPDMGNGSPRGTGGQHPTMDKNNAEKLKEAEATKEKKIKKILTKEQYTRWQEMRELQQEPLRPQNGHNPDSNGIHQNNPNEETLSK